MTAEQVSKRFGITESSLKNNFKRIQQKIKDEQNLTLEKEGRGKDCRYYIKEENANLDLIKQGVFNQSESVETALIKTDLSLLNLEFYCFLVLLLSPFQTFTGDYNLFAQYAEIKNPDILAAAINSLVDKKLVDKFDDNSTNEGYFTIRIIRKVTAALPQSTVTLDMIRKSQTLANKYRKREWIPILKTWAAIDNYRPFEVTTNKQLMEITGLTEYQIRQCNKILVDEGMLKIEKKFFSDGDGGVNCLGSSRALTAEFTWKEDENL